MLLPGGVRKMAMRDRWRVPRAGAPAGNGLIGLDDAALVVHPRRGDVVDLHGEIAHLLDFRFRRRAVGGLAGNLADGFQARSDAGDEFRVLEARVERRKPVQEIVHDVGLHQPGRALRRVVVGGDDGTDFESPEPSAEADHMGHFFVAQFDHGFFHVGLGLDEFELQLRPVAALPEIEEAVGVARKSLPDGKAFGLPQEGASYFLDQRFLLGDHGEESVADEGSEVERCLEAVVVNAVEIGVGDERNGDGFENLQLGEKALDRGCGELVDPEFLACVFVQHRLRGSFLRMGGAANGGEDGYEKRGAHVSGQTAIKQGGCPQGVFTPDFTLECRGASTDHGLMKTIIVPVDFSDTQGRLISAAEQEAKLRDASLLLLHIIEPAAEVAGFETDPEMMRLRIGQDFEAEERIESERLRELAKQIESRGVKCASSVKFGLPADEILSAVAEHGAGLVVMGSHGHGALFHLFSGSVVTGVLKRIDRPVLVVPLRAKSK
ncbi:MAG: universal stress protein [Chthoniobacterales bacterium]|nr:universal stress protein [Chthoniobacterales bacterium]